MCGWDWQIFQPRNCLRTERDTGMFPPCAWIPLSAPIVAVAEQSAVKSLECGPAENETLDLQNKKEIQGT